MNLIPRRMGFLDSFFDDNFFENRPRKVKDCMAMDINKEGEDYVISVELPGYDKDEVSVELEDGNLILTAERKNEINEDSDNYIHRERYYGKVSRTIYVGDHVDEEDIKAKLKDGVLKITLPQEKEQEELETKKTIEIE